MKHLKHLFCLLTAALLLLTASFALAEEPDLSAMNNSQIEALLLRVNQEIANRGIRKTARLAQGTYIAGRDIPCGSYVYTCLATGGDWGNVTVYSDEGSGRQLLWQIVCAPEEGEEPDTIFMQLHEGDQLKSGVRFSLTISGGILFE